MKKKNPTFERTYKILNKDRKVRTKVFKLPIHSYRLTSKNRIKTLAKKVYEGTLKNERKEK